MLIMHQYFTNEMVLTRFYHKLNLIHEVEFITVAIFYLYEEILLKLVIWYHQIFDD